MLAGEVTLGPLSKPGPAVLAHAQSETVPDIVRDLEAATTDFVRRG